MEHALSADGGPERQGPLEARLPAEIPWLRACLRRLLGRGRAGDVDDLLGEVMARALRSRASFDPAGSLRGWLRTTALRAVLDHRERQQRSPSSVDIDEADPPAGEAAGAELERREALEHLLARLAPVERDVLVRFHAEGRSVREIASAIGMAEGTVKSHLHRARRKLARLAGPEGMP